MDFMRGRSGERDRFSFFILLMIGGMLSIILITFLHAEIKNLEPEWVITWGEQWDDEGWDIIKIDDHLYVTGFISKGSEESDRELYLGKYRMDGSPVWESSWDRGSADVDLDLQSDGTFLSIGGWSKVGEINEALLQKRDLDGHLI